MIIKMSNIITVARNSLTEFTRQKNVGNCYEIYVHLNILRRMGLTNQDHTDLKPLVEQIAAQNVKSSGKILSTYQNLLNLPVGEGYFYKGLRVKGIRNVTQEDNDGGTGDLVLILENDEEKSISVCEGTKKKSGDVEKCLTNATCRRFGCTDSDLTEFKRIESTAVIEYKAEMKTKYGPDETVWKTRVPTKAASKAATEVALLTQARFNELPIEQRKSIMEDILRVQASSKPADMLCLVNTACTKHVMLEISRLNPCVWEPRLEADGIWLKMYLGETNIGKTQVKFNNGVYHKGKTSSLTSSWNASAVMNRVFELNPLTI